MKIKPLMRNGFVLKSEGPSFFVEAHNARRNRWAMYHKGRTYVGTNHGYEHVQNMVHNLGL